MRYRPLSLLLLLPLLAAATALTSQARGPGAPWRLETARGSVTVPETAARGFAALPLSALVSLGARVAYGGDGVTARLGERELAFRVGSADFRVDGGAVQRLASPVYEDGGVVYLPAQFFRDVLPLAAGPLLSVDGARRVIRVAESASVASAPSADSVVAPARRGAVAATLTGYVYAGAPEGAPGRPVVRPIGSEPGAAGPARAGSGDEVVAALGGRDSVSASAPSPGGGAVADTGAPPRRKLVVVDAGHGGRDPGARGPGGVREKDVALAVARRLAALLREDPTLEVRMTRDRDTLIALHDRARLANAWKDEGQPALFISVHCNANPSRAERGFETYFLSEARTADARRVEQFENAAVRFEERPSGDPLAFILTDLRQNQYLRESSEWAQMVQDALGDVHPGPDRGVKQADFAVLRGAFMPAVLVEIGFVSHAREEEVLASRERQEAIAGQLARSVRDFLEHHERESRGASPARRGTAN